MAVKDKEATRLLLYKEDARNRKTEEERFNEPVGLRARPDVFALESNDFRILFRIPAKAWYHNIMHFDPLDDRVDWIVGTVSGDRVCED